MSNKVKRIILQYEDGSTEVKDIENEMNIFQRYGYLRYKERHSDDFEKLLPNNRNVFCILETNQKDLMDKILNEINYWNLDG